MLMNSKNIASFGAKVERKEITPSQIEVNSEWLTGALTPKCYDTTISFKKITIELLFRANTRDLILKNISNFMLEVAECDIKFKNLSNTYHCFFVSAEPREGGFDDWLFLDLEFKGYEYSNEVISTIDNTLQQNITNEGNKKTPAIVEITPKGNLIDLTLEGLTEDKITIRNLKDNQKIIINAIDGTIFEGTKNKFNDIDLWEFPFLIPGVNTIKLSRRDVSIKIKFKPMWQ